MYRTYRQIRWLCVVFFLLLCLVPSNSAGAQSVPSAQKLYTIVPPCELATIDSSTGQVDIVGHIGFGVEDFTFSPTGELYAAASTVCLLHDSASILIKVDIHTGAATVIGPIGFYDVDALDFAPDGTLYAADALTNTFIKINPITGAGTAIGLFGYDFIGGMDFAPDGVLYGSAMSTFGGHGPGDLVTFDLAAGNATTIGSIGFSTVEGLAFAPDGTLYGISAAFGGGTGELIAIDIHTGAGHPIVLPSPLTLMDGLAIVPPTNTSPTITVNDVFLEGDTLGGRVLVFSDIGSASDQEDGVPEVECTPELGTILPLGQTSVVCTATDSGGLQAPDTGTVTVVDTTAPIIMCPANIAGTVGQAVTLGKPLVADIIDTNPIVTNNAPTSFSAGTASVIWTATDASSNSASCSQKVTLTYIFLGLYAPVDNLPPVNIAKAGQSIPFKWSLQDANGNYVSDLATVVNYGYGSAGSCSSTTDAIEEYADTGATSLRYDAAAHQFVLTSKTDKSWVGACKIFTLVLADGTKHQAKFNFTK
jgi:hypothetical protein